MPILLEKRRVRALDDPGLMAEVVSGHVGAFRELYDRYCHRAYGVAISVSSDDRRARDAVQAAFLSIWTNRASYRPQPGGVAASLLVSVRSRAFDASHRAGATPVGGHGTGPVTEPLARLMDLEQEAVTLAYYGKLTRSDIALVLGLPSSTVSGRMRLGLQQLRPAPGTEMAPGTLGY